MIYSHLTLVTLLLCSAGSTFANPSKPYAPELYDRSRLEGEDNSQFSKRSLEDVEKRTPTATSNSWGLNVFSRGELNKRGSIGWKCNGSDDSCEEDLFCALFSDTCKPKVAKGGWCSIDSGCQSGLSCVNHKCNDWSKPTKSGSHHGHSKGPAPSGGAWDKKSLHQRSIEERGGHHDGPHGPSPSGSPWDQKSLDSVDELLEGLLDNQKRDLEERHGGPHGPSPSGAPWDKRDLQERHGGPHGPSPSGSPWDQKSLDPVDELLEGLLNPKKRQLEERHGGKGPWAPSPSGGPWDKRILHKRVAKVHDNIEA